MPGFAIAILLILFFPGAAQPQDASKSFHPAIPRTRDDADIRTLEVPLAHAEASPVHVTSSYYYRIPVRPIYKSYPVYEPSHEPKGYWKWLQNREPVILWDDSGHRPQLHTEADWIKAGELVVEAPISFDTEDFLPEVRDSEAYSAIGISLTREGVNPFVHWVVRKKGTVELGFADCAECHSRLMPRTGDQIGSAWGAVVCVCKRQVVVEGYRFHRQPVPRDQEPPHVHQCHQQNRNHQPDPNSFGIIPMQLISKASAVLMTDNRRRTGILEPMSAEGKYQVTLKLGSHCADIVTGAKGPALPGPYD